MRLSSRDQVSTIQVFIDYSSKKVPVGSEGVQRCIEVCKRLYQSCGSHGYERIPAYKKVPSVALVSVMKKFAKVVGPVGEGRPLVFRALLPYAAQTNIHHFR